MKDTIYIDVEDDITAIVGKVKAAKSNIVALVPPKRVGVLQSAVNLRLLARAAQQNNKRLVLISGNSALMALAASAGIPSARTLQSKPELATIPDKDDELDDDIIDGAELPVGDLARTDGDVGAETAAAIAAPAIDSAIRANAAEEAAVAPLPRPPKASAKGIKVPNFDTVRKRLAIGVGALILLISFLIWAIWFAPSATIAITARTIESSANPSVVIATSATTDVKAGTLKATQQEIKTEANLEFTATGEKEVGEKAKGEVIFQNCESESIVSIPAGTGISAGGKTYITQSAATVPAAEGFAGCSKAGQSTAVAVVAQEIGSDYNTDEGTRFNVAGHSSNPIFYFRAIATTDIDGGSKRTIKVVSSEDVDKAADEQAKRISSDMKNQLTSKFGDTAIAIDASFKVNKSEVTSVPAVDAEAPDGKAKLSGSLKFTMIGVDKSEVSRFLDAYFAGQIKDDNQRVYENGADKTTFVDVKTTDNGATATMTATARFGPKINDEQVKSEAKGKRYGEVQSSIEGISGVESVDVKFSPFWVRTVPKDVNRITVKFNLDESNE